MTLPERATATLLTPRTGGEPPSPVAPVAFPTATILTGFENENWYYYQSHVITLPNGDEPAPQYATLPSWKQFHNFLLGKKEKKGKISPILSMPRLAYREMVKNYIRFLNNNSDYIRQLADTGCDPISMVANGVRMPWAPPSRVLGVGDLPETFNAGDFRGFLGSARSGRSSCAHWS